ncbi:MAG: 4-cresol dehydrogenase (hydroxylating) [Cycloclasticus pugetii]|jgi:4-cresol dehydrogenase (hydroxylating)|uniref:FAD-binding oxidoreductase n=1 Tax=Cycloclasticus pugetii TaxID=34068 RepID=UPI0039E25433
MTKPLPQGITLGQLNAAIAEIEKVVGKEYVYLDDIKELRSYRDPYNTTNDADFAPSAAVAPHNVEQIQKILAIVNNYKIPVWTISTGKNFAYGGPAPRKPGYIVLDLKLMNRILEVNEKHGYAIVEPGVSYYDLYNYLQEKGSKLWIDCAAPAWGGIVGNTSEHGAGYTPYGDHLLMQCGMQVVLADGTVVETGMDTTANSKTGGLYKYGQGAAIDGLFTQSNFGVITRMGIWLMPEPPGYTPFMITLENEHDLETVTDLSLPLRVNQVIHNAPMTVDLLWESAMSVSRSQYYTGKGPMPDSHRKKMAKDLDLGIWNYYGAVYGPGPMMKNNMDVIRDTFGSIPGAKFHYDDTRKGDPGWDYRVKLMKGVPNMTEFSLLNWVGGGGHINFSPISAADGKSSMNQYKMIEKRAHEYGFDYIGEFLIGWRDQHHIFMLMFNRMSPEEKKRAHDLFAILVDEAAALGYGEYRTHLSFMDQIAGTFSWNDNALWDTHHALKDELDPNGILSPGKQGIWPKNLRGES